MPSTLFVSLFIIWLPVVALATNDSHLRGIRAIQSQTAVPKSATMVPFRIFVNVGQRLPLYRPRQRCPNHLHSHLERSEA